MLLRRSLLWSILLAAGAAASIMAACSGGDDADSNVVSDEFRAAAPAAAESSLLTIENLPAGWSGTQAENGGDDSDLELGPECDVLLANLDAVPGEIASAESDDFTGPDGQQVSSGAAVFATEAAAQDAVDAINDAVDSCRADFEDALLEFFRVSLEEDPDIDQEALDEIDVEVLFEDLSFADVGDSVSAYRLNIDVTVADERLEPTADIVLLRQGRLTGGLFFFALDLPSIANEEALAITIVSQMQEADEGLPD
jgi:hypothetical protein